MIVVAILAAAIAANVYANTLPSGRGGEFPVHRRRGHAALLLLAPWRRPDFSVIPGAAKGAVFLLSLVLAASMMPVE